MLCWFWTCSLLAASPIIWNLLFFLILHICLALLKKPNVSINLLKEHSNYPSSSYVTVATHHLGMWSGFEKVTWLQWKVEKLIAHKLYDHTSRTEFREDPSPVEMFQNTRIVTYVGVWQAPLTAIWASHCIPWVCQHLCMPHSSSCDWEHCCCIFS